MSQVDYFDISATNWQLSTHSQLIAYYICLEFAVNFNIFVIEFYY